MWTIAGYGLSMAIRLGSNLLMTRLLVPDVFGIMAISTVIMAGLNMFSDLGLKQNIIHSVRGDDQTFLNTAWVFQIFRGFVLWSFALGIDLILVVAVRHNMAPRASVYADPRLPYVIAALSFSVIIGGFNSTKLFQANRHLALGSVTMLTLAAQLSGVLTMLSWASFDRSISALVAGNICASLVTMLLSHIWLKGNANRWEWEPSAFREIFHFGKWLFVSSILFFIVTNSDRILLGAMVDKDMLGIYVIAFFIVDLIRQGALAVVSNVAFPALSVTARERRNSLRANYYRMHFAITLFVYFCLGALIVSGRALISILYDIRYAQAGWMLQLLSIGLLLVPFQMSIQYFMALGNTRINTVILAVRLASLYIGMPIGFYFFGLPGAIAGAVISDLSTIPIVAFNSSRYGLFDLTKELSFVPMLGLGAVAGALFSLATRHWRG